MNRKSIGQLGTNSCVSVENKESTVVRRKLPQCDGVYVNGTIQGVAVVFTADTGSSSTIISERIYNTIPRKHRPTLVPSRSLANASGVPLRELGKAIFTVTFGDLKLTKQIIVASIEDDGLLGVDILQNLESGPADIIQQLTSSNSQGIIRLQGVDIPCIQIGKPNESIRKVHVMDDVTIPGTSEMIVDVLIDRDKQSDAAHDLLIEPVSSLTDRYGLVMAPTLVDSNNVVSQVRVMNPYTEICKLQEGTVVGQVDVEAETCIVDTLIASESVQDAENHNRVRRINHFQEKEVESSVVKGDNSKMSGKTSNMTVPTHLQSLFEASSECLTDREAAVLADMLKKYESTFSKDEHDLGLTDVMCHSIDTGDSKPIKQPPRRVPIALAGEELKAIKMLEKQ